MMWARGACVGAMALAAVLCLLVGGVVAADGGEGAGADGVRMDFEDADIRSLIKYISDVTGRNFIVDRRVKGRVTVLSPRAITADEAYGVFASVLEVHGFTTVEQGAVTKIVPSAQAQSMSVPTRAGLRPSAGGEAVMTQVLPLTHASSLDLRKALSGLVSAAGLMADYPAGNMLIVTDYRSNVERIAGIVRRADTAARDGHVGVFAMRHGSAPATAEVVTRLLAERREARLRRGESVSHTVAGLARTNTVIVVGVQEDVELVRRLVRAMDVPTPEHTGTVHLVYLENADAASAAEVLRTLMEERAGETGTDATRRHISVVADTATNALAIAAPQEEFAVLSQMIRRLDVARRQVYVEALIMEVSADKGLSFGVNWSAGGTTRIDGTDALVFGGSNPGGAPSVVDGARETFSMPSGFSAGLVLFPFTIGDQRFNSVESLISASKVDTGFKVLATPQLLTLDNEEARVDVVDTIPFVERVTTESKDTESTQSITYKDVGVKLTVTPQIGTHDMLRLRLHQEVSRVVNKTVSVGESEPLLLAPTTKKREVETTVQVRDGQTIVIAGLLSRDESRDRNQVPGLGDVPGLGWLFKSKSTRQSDTNLLLFLTPRIIDSPEHAARIAREKRRELERVGVDDDGLGEAWIAPPPLPQPVLEP